jgi:hypothetical protein
MYSLIPCDPGVSCLLCRYIGFYRQKWLKLPLLVFQCIEIEPIFRWVTILAILGQIKCLLCVAQISLSLILFCSFLLVP